MPDAASTTPEAARFAGLPTMFGAAAYFVFDGGVLADDAPIQLQESELDHYRFVESADLARYLPPVIATRVNAALRGRGTGTTAYIPWSEP